MCSLPQLAVVLNVRLKFCFSIGQLKEELDTWW